MDGAGNTRSSYAKKGSVTPAPPVRNSTAAAKVRIKSRLPLKRRLGETALPAKQFRDPNDSISSLVLKPKKTLGPSINPIRKSFETTTNTVTREFVIHYHRKLHSHIAVDSRHEAFYMKNGLPSKPRYNPAGRRFTDSSEEDQDYDTEGFKKEALVLNARASVEEEFDPRDYEPDSDDIDTTQSTIAQENSETSTATKIMNNKVYPDTNGSSSGRSIFKDLFCCCFGGTRKEQKPSPSSVSVNKSQMVNNSPQQSIISITIGDVHSPTGSLFTSTSLSSA